MRDPDPELAHPEAAGWVLGTLDQDDAEWFAGHLPSCPDCRAAVAEFGPTARLLVTAAPAGLPPPGLQARTLAGVAQAATAARPEPPVAGLVDPDAGAGRGGGHRRGHHHRAAGAAGRPRRPMRSRCIRGRGCPHRPAGPCGRLTAAGRSSSPRSACPSRGRPVLPVLVGRAGEPGRSSPPGQRGHLHRRPVRDRGRAAVDRGQSGRLPGHRDHPGQRRPAGPAGAGRPVRRRRRLTQGPATWWRGRSPAGPARRAAPASHGTRASSPSPAEAPAGPRSGTGSGLPR